MSASTSPRKAPEGASLPPTPIRTANILSNEARQLLAVDIHRTVGHYKLGKTIGQGSYGKVKLAVDIRTGQKFAMKIMEKSNVKNARQIFRIQREIRFLKLLHHPHIVKVLEVMETDECIYIVMEYAMGGELFDYLVAHGKLKENEARSFFRQVLSAVDYCHSNSIIHRDLKPENLLLDSNKNIKIIDFGFGNTFKADAFLDTFCGSPFYAAPEMICGIQYRGPEVDMWSLGVILFALVCGHLPFDDKVTKELYRKISTASYQMPEGVPVGAEDLIRRMITVDPVRRATLVEVKTHRWVCEGHDGAPNNFLPKRPTLNPTNIDQGMANALTVFGHTADEIKNAVDRCASSFPDVDPIISTYHLLREMHEREEQANELANAGKLQSLAQLALTDVCEGNGMDGSVSLGPQTPTTSLTASSKNLRVNTPPRHQSSNNLIKNCAISSAEPTTASPPHSSSPTSSSPFALRSRFSVTSTPQKSSPAAPHSRNTQRTMPTVFGFFNQWSSTGGLIATSPTFSTPTFNQSTAATPHLNSPPFFVSPLPTPLKSAPLNSVELSRELLSPIMETAADHHRQIHHHHPALISTMQPTKWNSENQLKPPVPMKVRISTASVTTSTERIAVPSPISISKLLQNANGATAKPESRISARISTTLNVSTDSHLSKSHAPTKPKPNSYDIGIISTWLTTCATSSSTSPALMIHEVIRALQFCQYLGTGLQFEHDEVECPWIITCEVNALKFIELVGAEASSSADGDQKINNNGVNETSMEEMDISNYHSKNTNFLFDSDSSTDATISSPKHTVLFQMEIGKVARLNLHGLNFKRLDGSVWDYKEVCDRIIKLIKF